MDMNGHEAKYTPDAWRQWGMSGLATWVAMLHERATKHRVPGASKAKDLADARNYLKMMEQLLDEAENK
jgi:hypothetical protein